MIAPIAAGGMASVWAARLRGPSGFSKVVAIKAMLPELADEPEYRTMFLDEARVASRLRHPNVCETFDLGEENGALFMAMEWIDGVSLQRVLKAGGSGARPIPFELAARIIAAACAGLHAAHEAVDDDGTPLAIVHRDVSPQNVLIAADGQVKVTDFGIARARGQRHATAAGQAKGKLAYMAPEQLKGVPVDRRVDVFALGCVLYEITTGVKPFDAATDAGVLRAILERTPRRPSAIVAGYPDDLERILARAMGKDPAERFASADGLRIALERWLSVRTERTERTERPAGAVRASQRDIAALVYDRCGAEIASIRAQIQANSNDAPDTRDASSDAAEPPPVASPRADRWRAARFGFGWGGLGGLVIAIACGSVFWAGLRPLAEPADATASLAPTAERSTVPDPAPPGGLSSAIRTEPAARPAAVFAETARVTLHFDPPNAHVVLDGDPLELSADAQATIEKPLAGEMRVGLVKAPGHVDRLFVVDPNTPMTLEISLTKTHASAPSRPDGV